MRKIQEKTFIAVVTLQVLLMPIISLLPIQSRAVESVQSETREADIKIMVDDGHGKPVSDQKFFVKDLTNGKVWKGQHTNKAGTAVMTDMLMAHKYDIQLGTAESADMPHSIIDTKGFKGDTFAVRLSLEDIVSLSDLGDQLWLQDLAEHYTGKKVGQNMTFADLANLTSLKNYTGFVVRDTTPIIPKEIKYFTGLTELNLSRMNLTGSIPTEIGDLQNLTYLHVAFNSLTGGIPASIGQLTNLRTLYLGANNYTGSIPANFGKLTNLVDMDISSSHLSGTIDQLAGLTNLTRLRLENNYFVGQIPDGLYHINFSDLDFRNNEFTLNQVGEKKLDNGKVPKYANTFVNDRTLSVEDASISVKGDTVRPFQDFGLKSALNGTKSDLFADHTYQIYRKSDNVKIFDGTWDAGLTFPQFKNEETYRIVLDGATDNPNNNAEITVHTAPDPILAVKNEFSNVTTGTTSYHVGDEIQNISTIRNSVANAAYDADISIHLTDGIEIDQNTLKLVHADGREEMIDPASYDNDTRTLHMNTKQTETQNGEIQIIISGKIAASAKNKKITGDLIAVEKNTNQNYEDDSSIQVEDGKLQFEKVPETINFSTTKLPAKETTVTREDPNWKMIVSDTREKKTNWYITAKQLSPFQSTAGNTLNDILVYKNGTQNQIINTADAVTVFDGLSNGSQETYEVGWTQDEGVLLQVKPGNAAIGSYTSTIQWTLNDAPV